MGCHTRGEYSHLLDVFLWAVYPQTLGGDFEFTGGIAEAQERQDPHQDADCLGLQTLESSDVHGLRTVELVNMRSKLGVFWATLLVTQPVAKIHALHHGGGPFVAVDEGQRLEYVLDISMAPVLAFNGGDGGDVTGSKGMHLW